MASIAKIGLNSKVIDIVSLHNNELKDSNGIEQEVLGVQFLEGLTGWSIWKQTSYNTHGGIHNSNKTPLRKNYAGIGYSYDEDKDAFIAPKPYSSWTLNETTCHWEAPVTYPTDDNNYIWNETTTTWDLTV